MFRLWVNSCVFSLALPVFIFQSIMPSRWMEEKKPWQEQGSQERSVQVGEHGFTSEKLLLGVPGWRIWRHCFWRPWKQGIHGGREATLPTHKSHCLHSGGSCLGCTGSCSDGALLTLTSSVPTSSPGCAVALRPVPWSSPRSAFLLRVFLVAVRGCAACSWRAPYPHPWGWGRRAVVG